MRLSSNTTNIQPSHDSLGKTNLRCPYLVCKKISSLENLPSEIYLFSAGYPYWGPKDQNSRKSLHKISVLIANNESPCWFIKLG